MRIYLHEVVAPVYNTDKVRFDKVHLSILMHKMRREIEIYLNNLKFTFDYAYSKYESLHFKIKNSVESKTRKLRTLLKITYLKIKKLTHNY